MRVGNLVAYLHCHLHASDLPQLNNCYGGKTFLSEQQKILALITRMAEAQNELVSCPKRCRRSAEVV